LKHRITNAFAEGTNSVIQKFFLDYYSKESDVLKSFASDTVTKWIEHSMLPDDITIMNIRF